MNFSHGSHEYHQSVIDNARAAEAQQAGRPLAIALDTKGPEIRTGDMVNGEDVKITAGHKMIITTDPAYKDKCDDKYMFVDYTNLPKVIDKGKPIFVDDGVLSFHVIDIDGCAGPALTALTAAARTCTSRRSTTASCPRARASTCPAPMSICPRCPRRTRATCSSASRTAWT